MRFIFIVTLSYYLIWFAVYLFLKHYCNIWFLTCLHLFHYSVLKTWKYSETASRSRSRKVIKYSRKMLVYLLVDYRTFQLPISQVLTFSYIVAMSRRRNCLWTKIGVTALAINFSYMSAPTKLLKKKLLFIYIILNVWIYLGN